MISFAQCAATLSGGSLCKKRKLKKTVLLEFIVHTYLVVKGVRQGYLVDCFSLDASSLHSLMELVLHTLAIRDSSLVILELPTGDFFLLSQLIFTQRVNICSSDNTFFKNSILVDISGDHNPRVMPSSDVHAVTDHLADLCRTVVERCRNVSPGTDACSPTVISLLLEPNTTVLGYEALAGWLLGYTCIYNCAVSPVDGASRYQQSLSMLPLCKKSVVAAVVVQPGEVVEATVKEFTVPLCVLGDMDKTSQKESDLAQEFISTELFDDLVQRDFEAMRCSLQDDELLQKFVQDSVEVNYSSLAF